MHGLLCESCCLDLVLVLTDAPRQVSELAANLEPSMQWALTAQPAAATVKPRINSSAPDFIKAARSSMSVSDTEAIRSACLDAGRAIEDALSALVEHVADEWGESGPARVRAAAERDDARALKWHPAYPDGRPTFRADPLVTRHGDGGEVEQGQYVWEDPPERFAVATACRWLREQLRRVSHTEGIGDALEHLGDLMSRGHALAPWREPSQPLRGVPCPQCHRMSLHFFPDSAMAKCQAMMCGKAYPWARIAIWTRVLEDDRAAGQRPGTAWTSERGV